MVAFGVIIVLHCFTWSYSGHLVLAEYKGTKANGHYVENPPAIKDVNMPLFALAVFYAGIFSLLGESPNQKKETTERKKAEREETERGVTAARLAPSANLSKRRKSDNYFARAWRGEVSLGRSYWLNGVLLGLGLRLTIGTLVDLAKQDPTLIARGLGGAVMAMFIVTVAWMIWWTVGTGRAANAYTGFAGWAVLAKIMLVIQVWVGLLGIWWLILFLVR
jgi:hypothetical protein